MLSAAPWLFASRLPPSLSLTASLHLLIIPRAKGHPPRSAIYTSLRLGWTELSGGVLPSTFDGCLFRDP
ncbi:hypothetical protein IE53DRAFT_389113 [Violaceomyces palustris]|uniref:Uncharacterized protein n=1 Tax=Violaceomyces palustris TaxID=1673888 RepID=A0ACD0NS80_9BASI|nr:hypothetical protein IE53DRAFT_389113 [Violaceomyces palustris]